MNSLRDEALPATCKWRRCFVSALFILATPALFATPPKAAAAQDAKNRPVQSDTLPMDVIVTAPDLLLSQDAEHKAEALAMFVTALIDEDNAENDQALEKFQKTLNLDPGYTELAIKVAIELARRGDPTAGINILKDSIKAVPKEQLCYLCLSQIYEKYLKKPDMAIKYASQGLELNPKNPVPYIALYELYIADKQEKNARQILDRAMKLENTMPEYWLELGGFLTRLYVKGDSAIAPEDLKKMNAVFQKALELGEGSLKGDLLMAIARCQETLHDSSKARSIYDRILSELPNTEYAKAADINKAQLP